VGDQKSMIEPNEHIRERERIKELKSYSILDTLPEKDYDNLTSIAAGICDTPVSLVSLLDEKRQWFKSHHGIDAIETLKEYSFCAHAINDQNNILIVEDARNDERFHDNPLVTGKPYVIFYAGVPLISDHGLPLGTLCVIDHKPNRLDQNQKASLFALSNQVMNLLKLRKRKLLLEKALHTLEEKNKDLERFAMIAAHDLKSPLNNIASMINLVMSDHVTNIDSSGKKLLETIADSSIKLGNLIDGLLAYSRSDKLSKDQTTKISIDELIKGISELSIFNSNINISLKSTLKEIYVNKSAIEQTLMNLVTNAIKYNDQSLVKIEIGISDLENYYEFYVQDNGWGIAADKLDNIFKLFKTGNKKDKLGRTGSGIGLATVKKIVETFGGSIRVESVEKRGSKFIFTIEKREELKYKSIENED
jgi:signal transduction histidine kinase